MKIYYSPKYNQILLVDFYDKELYEDIRTIAWFSWKKERAIRVDDECYLIGDL